MLVVERLEGIQSSTGIKFFGEVSAAVRCGVQSSVVGSSGLVGVTALRIMEKKGGIRDKNWSQ